MRTKFLLVALSLLFLPAAFRAQSGTSDDEKAIREIESQWEAAWNHHDPAALARLATPDTDFINIRGAWAKGRDQMEKAQTARHQTTEKDSVWKTDEVDIRFLTPDVAIVHVYWFLSGERNADGSPGQPYLGVFTRTEVKRDGQWLIAASQATEVSPQSRSQGASNRQD
ncbi:MAG TPA: SgcJ/EcaC family oxidoreductase [Candidatus Acidoferrales bacterium]|nr:SgcJ/EcaC family oxidoreductase [Candidatus Acidoferrales bacterium]